tara:strand:- start:2118 stop:2804 length:687 start_codon:yes stop_codon:yes gene_type:complete
MNYTELVAAIEAYAENYDTSAGGFVDNIPVFVKNAEQRIYNSVQLPPLRRNSTGTLTVNNKYLSCPNDFLAVYSLAVINSDDSYTYLLNKDVNFIRQAYPTPTDVGTPAYYALFGPQYTYPTELSFILGPTPDDSYEVELHYFYYPESIVDAGTTWLGDNFDSVLLYGSLMEAASFMKSDNDTVVFYKDRYTEALSLLKRLGDGLERGDAYRDGQTKLNVNLKGSTNT